jgi:dTDP-glucose 4,6-dehydratase
MRVVITGGAGFVGSHLCSRLVAEGNEVVCLDNFLTGDAKNVEDLAGDRFRLVKYDLTQADFLHIDGPVDLVLHFASPASPIDYLGLPIQTLKAGAMGSHKALGLALDKGSRIVLASTSEVYGDPEVNPQPESYWGHVNPVGPRSVYDEAKRFQEALAMAYHRTHGLDVKLARIFNTYGPRMRLRDGRAVPAFMAAALRGEPLIVHGDGTQTRSLCYVDDLVEGILRLAGAEHIGTMNIGNPDEITVLELAKIVLRVTGSSSPIQFGARPVDDPGHRCPDISLARRVLVWEPQIGLEEGLMRTSKWFREAIA